MEDINLAELDNQIKQSKRQAKYRKEQRDQNRNFIILIVAIATVILTVIGLFV